MTRKITADIVLVVSPFVNLIKDQVGNLQMLGIAALSGLKNGAARAAEEGQFSVVCGTSKV